METQTAVNPELELGADGASVPNPDQPSTINSQPSASVSFPRADGESARAFRAFSVYFQLGDSRNLSAVASQLNELLSTVKKWSSRFSWLGRIQAYNAGILQEQAQARAETQRRHAEEWTKRENDLREQEWGSAQKLSTAAHCFLENFGDEEVQKMNLAQVSRALDVSSRIGRLALAGTGRPEKLEPAMSPAQTRLMEALDKMYGPKESTSADGTPNPGDNV